MQYHMMMAMKATKGGGKGFLSNQYASSPYSGGKGGDKGKGKSETRECYNCGGKGHLARNCPQPKSDSRSSRVLAREVGHEEGEELIWGACVIDEVQDVGSDEEEKKKKLAQRSHLKATGLKDNSAEAAF